MSTNPMTPDTINELSQLKADNALLAQALADCHIEIERLRYRFVQCLDNMRQLVWEHHCSTIMQEHIAICPLCDCKRWSDVLDEAARLTQRGSI